jgi:chromosome partitioning protein
LDPTDVNGIIKALINARAFASETIDILEEARHA